MLTDLASLYPSTLINPVCVTRGYAPHKLVVKGKGKIRIQFINPYYNSGSDMFMEAYTSEMLYCMYDMLIYQTLFHRCESLWQERRL